MDEALELMRRFYIDEQPSRRRFAKEKLRIAKAHGLPSTPTNIDVFLSARSDVERRALKPLRTKPMRNLSGVSVVAIMTEPRLCPHGKCIYCPGGPKSVMGDVPMAYTGHEPASMRGARCDYDAYLQVFTRLEQYVSSGHVPQKIELIIMGGTLPSYELSYQEAFVRDALCAMNDFSTLFFTGSPIEYDAFKEFFELPARLDDAVRSERIHERIREVKADNDDDLARAQQRNESAAVRCVGMTMETRADFSMFDEANRMLEQGATRVELGVQSVSDEVLEYTGRSHAAQDNKDATRTLKDLGFKVNYHMMPGLPQVTLDEDLAGLRMLFADPQYRPDMLKIYPTGVFPGTVLHDYYMLGHYKPLRIDDAVPLLATFLPEVPAYVRVMRVQRDIPSHMFADGVLRTNLRQYVEDEMRARHVWPREIRYREIGLNAHRLRSEPDERMLMIAYEASGGREFFISYEDCANDVLLGFVRVRFPSESLREEVTDRTAFVRELHVYGDAELFDRIGRDQHRGIGKRLMAKAEELCVEHGKHRVLVISGIGVRGYYVKLGYTRMGPYMGKDL
jgi:elongator complex protein 3